MSLSNTQAAHISYTTNKTKYLVYSIICVYIFFCFDLDQYREFEQTIVNVRGTLTSQPVSDVLHETSKMKVEAALQSLLK